MQEDMIFMDKKRMGLKDIFDIENIEMKKGAWWWWFWLFFFDNPKDPEKPRQLMILWSAKDEKAIGVNDMVVSSKRKGNDFEGVVAAWYFDGEKMQHEYVLEDCMLSVLSDSIESGSKIPTSYHVKDNKHIINIGDELEFIACIEKKNELTEPVFKNYDFIGDLSYALIRLNHLDLKGNVNGEDIKGTAYFQRVFVNSPAPSWYWGIFHFKNGALLTYFNPYVLGQSVKKDIAFFDGEKSYKFSKIKVRRTDKENGLPDFQVTGEDKEKKIEFTVSAYSHSAWTFTKKKFKVIPNKLVYNEYPALITDLAFSDKITGKTLTLKDLGGNATGNAEHSTGILL